MNDQIHNIQIARLHIQKLREEISQNANKICLLESQVHELLKIQQSTTIPIKGISKIDFVPIYEIL